MPGATVMKKTLACFLLAATTLLAAVSNAETYALIIGINDYPEPLDSQGNPLKDDKGNVITDDLKGCVNDAKFWKETLMTAYGVKEANIHVLLDSLATEANFIAEVRWLVNTAKPGDRIFFSYSGHGSQIALPDQPEESDGLTEVICLIDTLVPDNFFADWAKDLKTTGVNATFVFDSCHSGGMTRDPDSGGRIFRKRWMPKDRLNAKQRANHFDAIEQAEVKLAMRTTRAQVQGSYVFLLASQENQTSGDVQFVGDNPPPYGAFTYWIRRTLRSNPQMSIQDLLTAVKKGLKEWEFEQLPLAEYSDSKGPSKPVMG